MPWLGQIDSLIRCIQKRVEGNLSLPNTLLIVSPVAAIPANSEMLNRMMGSGRFAKIIQRSWPALVPSITLCEKPRVRVRYSRRSALMKFTSERLAAEWLTVVQTLPMPHGDPTNMEISNHLRIRRDISPESDGARLGAGPNALTIGSALNELRAFGDILLTAIVDPQLVMRELAGSAPTSIQVGQFDKDLSLLQQLPLLSERVDVLSHYFSLSPTFP
jgi:hypothetical protein